MVGDVGPCDYSRCRERATHKVHFHLNARLVLVAYLCDQHTTDMML